MRSFIKIGFIASIFAVFVLSTAANQDNPSVTVQNEDQNFTAPGGPAEPEPISDKSLSEAFAMKLIEQAKKRRCAKKKESCEETPIDYDALPVHNLPDGSIFHGTLVNNLKQGPGRLVYPSGDIYEGYFVDDMRHGRGKLEVKSTGLHYFGEFENDLLNGSTVMYTEDMVYEGRVKNGSKHGVGRLVSFGDDPFIYEGEFVENVFNGTGRITYDNGTIYYGMFLDGKRHGAGRLTLPGGTKYEGYWENDRKNGKGLQNWSDGRSYVGDWVNGKIEGVGEYNWPDGSKYLGEWKQGKFEGPGEYLIANEGRYEGYFSRGKMEGRGRFYWDNGTTYEGEWKNSKMDGRGMLTMMNGEVYTGMFLGGEFDGLGIFEFLNGTTYYGEWKGGKKSGGGMFSYGNGTDLRGIWVGDEFVAEENNVETYNATLIEGIDYDELSQMLKEMNAKRQNSSSEYIEIEYYRSNETATDSLELQTDTNSSETLDEPESQSSPQVTDQDNLPSEDDSKHKASTEL
mgnify:FL=1